MAIPTGTKLGPYEILQPIGAGGMGEVYKATDTRLGRTVAVKILPEHLSDKPALKQRFEREAKAIAGLNHPHVCTLYDVGNQDGTDFLVMEYLEGETLAERLAKGPLALDVALRYAIEIADALDKAHGLGVTHRDLKPGNVMLTKSGTKLLDFGLAKWRATESQPAFSQIPTAAPDLTAHGTLLGTVQYMAPEQIEGEDADARTDIFAFGALLYEMITRSKAFKGKSQAGLMASILEHDPPALSSLQPLTPPALQRVVEICLAKEPQNRWQTAHDLMLQLQWIAEGGSQIGLVAPVAQRRKNRERIERALLVVAVLVVIALAIPYVWRTPQDVRSVRFSIFPSGTSTFGPSGAPIAPFPTVSPDGRHLAFIAQEAGEPSQIWLRTLDSVDAQPVPGTEGVQGAIPFWSPDSRYIGFAAGGKLKKVEPSGGPVQVICDASGVEATWNREGTILFASTGIGGGGSSYRGGLFRVSDAGGEPIAVSTPNDSHSLKETGHRLPHFLPDGRHFLYLAQQPNTIYAGSLDSKEVKRLLAADSAAMYSPPGYLLFVRQGTLMGQAFDAQRLELTGEPFRIAESVRSIVSNGRAAFSVSENGTLVYRIGAGTSFGQRVIWVDRGGKRDDSINQTGDNRNPRLSPDGKFVAVQRTDPAAASDADLWIIDLLRGVNSRLTFGAAAEQVPVWAPDGSRIVFRANPSGTYDLYQKLSSGTANEEILLKSDQTKTPTDWSADGRLILFTSLDPVTNNDIWVLRLSPDRKPEVFLKTPFSETNARFSADGRWVAYNSNESGNNQIYIQPFPPTGQRVQISVNGGLSPQWRRDGRALFFLSGPLGQARSLMEVEIKAGSTIEPGTPKELMKFPFPGTPDITSDGRLITAATFGNAGDSESAPITVVLNWAAGLKR